MPRWPVKVPCYMNFIVVQKSMFKFLETASAVIQSLTSYKLTAFGSPWISEVALSRYKSYLEYSGLGLL